MITANDDHGHQSNAEPTTLYKKGGTSIEQQVAEAQILTL